MCQNPFKKCKNQDCEVIILYNGERREICHECWAEIAESDHEWSSNNRTDTEEEVS